MSFGSASTRSSSGSTPAPVSRAGRKEINHHVAVYRYAPLPPTSSKRRLLRSLSTVQPWFAADVYSVEYGRERRDGGGRQVFHLREPSGPRSWGHQPLPDRTTLRERGL